MSFLRFLILKSLLRLPHDDVPLLFKPSSKPSRPTGVPIVDQNRCLVNDVFQRCTRTFDFWIPLFKSVFLNTKERQNTLFPISSLFTHSFLCSPKIDFWDLLVYICSQSDSDRFRRLIGFYSFNFFILQLIGDDISRPFFFFFSQLVSCLRLL